jgi:hypothetical protein
MMFNEHKTIFILTPKWENLEEKLCYAKGYYFAKALIGLRLVALVQSSMD